MERRNRSDSQSNEVEYTAKVNRTNSSLLAGKGLLTLNSWVATRPEVLAEAGFESCLVRQYTIPEHHLKAFADMQFMVNEELSYGLMDEETGEEYRTLISQSWAESLNGVVIQHWPTVTVGRVPR